MGPLQCQRAARWREVELPVCPWYTNALEAHLEDNAHNHAAAPAQCSNADLVSAI
jgi:hypothetical protein